jgi:hypothetical protein
VVPLEGSDRPRRSRIGFMKGKIRVPDDFDTLMRDEIEDMFYNSALEP